MEDFACAPCIEEEHYLVDACTHGHSKLKESGMSCQICTITDFVGVYHLPVVTIFRNRVLKARFYPTDRVPKIPQEPRECRFCDTKGRLKKYEGMGCQFMNDTIFHIINWMSLWSVSPTLNDLWHAQGFGVVILRTTEQPRKTWKRCYYGKKDEWRANGIMAALLLTAATALSGNISDGAPRLLCLASIACNLGSAIGSTSLLTRFQNENAMRLAWFEGGALFIMAISAPSAWLRWGIVTFVGALLTHLWKSLPLPADAVMLFLIAVQFILFIYQSYAFRDDSQCSNVARPLRIDSAKECLQIYTREASSNQEMVQNV